MSVCPEGTRVLRVGVGRVFAFTPAVCGTAAGGARPCPSGGEAYAPHPVHAGAVDHHHRRRFGAQPLPPGDGGQQSAPSRTVPAERDSPDPPPTRVLSGTGDGGGHIEQDHMEFAAVLGGPPSQQAPRPSVGGAVVDHHRSRMVAQRRADPGEMREVHDRSPQWIGQSVQSVLPGVADMIGVEYDRAVGSGRGPLGLGGGVEQPVQCGALARARDTGEQQCGRDRIVQFPHVTDAATA